MLAIFLILQNTIHIYYCVNLGISKLTCDRQRKQWNVLSGWLDVVNISGHIHDNHVLCYIPYILESNPHPFYSFRGLKMQMRIRIECALDSQSRAGVWPNDRAGVHAIRTIQGGKNEVRIRFENIR
jgi:hypothetical protein